MKTLEYPYCKFQFDEFNPLQEQASKYFDKDFTNLIVSASVAAGKTVIHEAIAGYELSKDEYSKIVYTCPMKAIAQQKFNDWKQHETFKKYKMLMLSSDKYVTQKQLQDARIIVSTIQSMNVCCRRGDEWIKNVVLFTFDQAHLFNHEKRGAGSQALIMNIAFLSPQCRIVCLSGTLSNIKEIAKWIKNLTGNPTVFIDSKWRPTKLYKRIEITENTKEQLKYLQDLINKSYGEKILIFVQSKKIGQYFLKQLRSCGIRCAFYSSDLTFEKRQQMIQRFRDKFDNLNVLLATNSLSMGVTL